MDSSELDNLRHKIDSIDHDIIDLLAQRIDITKSVDKYKVSTGVPRYDAKRWQSASEKRASIAKQLNAPHKLVTTVFDDIHHYVLDDVYAMPEACYLGPEGSFSHIAAQQSVDLGQYRLKPCADWTKLYDRLRKSPDSIAVVPVENSISSSVHTNVDAIFEGDLYIIGQTYLDINFGLFAKDGAALSDVRHVYSHPQALLQARKKILENGWQQYETSSTSAALEYVKSASKNDVACLAPVGSVAHGVHQLSDSFQDIAKNQTRFLTITSQKPEKQTGQKVSVLFELKHETGSLERLLQILANQQFNLTKIESRPIPDKAWAYRFWIDFESSEQIDIDLISELLDSQKFIELFIVLGIYTV